MTLKAARTDMILLLLVPVLLLSCRASQHPDIEESNATSTPKPSFSLSAHQRTPGDTVLTLTLTNLTDKPLVMHESELPWKNRYSLYVIVVPQHTPDRPLQMHFASDDSLPIAIVIKPQATLTGELDLRDRFIDIRERLSKERPLFAFWEYELTDATRRSLGRQFGGSTLY